MKNSKPSSLHKGGGHSRKRFLLLLAVAAGSCLLVTACSLCLGEISFDPVHMALALFGKGERLHVNIVRFSRIPRTLACLAAGAALASAGAVLQNILANQLASPGIVGVNAGAGLGVTLCSALGLLSGWAVSAFAFCGSLITVFVIALISGRTGASKSTVILVGVALNSMLGAISESIAVLVPDVAQLTAEFRLGGFSAVSYERLLPALIMIAAALVLLLTLMNELEIVSLGDETAASVGLRAGRYRLIFLILAALLAGSAVSFAGLLGFVGLIIPHFVRKLVGNHAHRLLPLCILTGATFVCLCDLLSRLIFMPYELPVGILMAVIGCPVFVSMLIHMRGGRRIG